MGVIIWAATIGAHAALAVFLSRNLKLVAGLMVYMVVATLLTCLAGMLLRQVSTDSVTWKNRVAGLLLPWATFVGGGQLRSLLIKNGLASIVFGVLVVVCDQVKLLDSIVGRSREAGGTTDWGELAISWLTLACWLLLLLAWLWILRSLVKHQADIVSVLLKGRNTWIPLLVPPIAIGLSIALKLSGYAWSALLVVGVPLLVTLMPVLLLATVFMIHWVTGKPIRWN